MALRAAPLSDSRTVDLDGLSIRISRSVLRDIATVTILQSGRVVAVGRATADQLGEVIDTAGARRNAMRSAAIRRAGEERAR
jgi:hypothetical protein